MKKKKLQKLAAMLICAALAFTMVAPIVTYAATLLEHDRNGKTWGDVPSGYLYSGAYTTTHINGLAYRVVGVNATTAVCNQQLAINSVVNGGFNATTSKTEAENLMLVMPTIGGNKYNAYLTVEGKFSLYGDPTGTVADSVLWVKQNTNPIDASDNEETKYQKYLSYLIDGVALPASMESSTLEDGVFNYMFEKWAESTSNEVMYSDYLTNKNCEGSGTYYVIELYYLSGARSNSADSNGETYALMGSSKSLAKYYGELSDLIWERSGNYLSSNDYATMLQGQLLGYVEDEDANDLLQLRGALSNTFNNPTRSVTGRFCGSAASSNRYGVGVIVPYTNSGRPGATTSIVPQDFELKVIDDSSISYASSVGYAYRNVSIGIEDSAYIQRLLTAARFADKSAAEQEKYKNIELTIEVQSTTPGTFVGGWELHGSAANNILADNFIYPIRPELVSSTKIDGTKDGVSYMSLAKYEREFALSGGYIDPNALCFGTGSSAPLMLVDSTVSKYTSGSLHDGGETVSFAGNVKPRFGNVSVEDIFNAEHYVQTGVQSYDKYNFVCPPGYTFVDYVLWSSHQDSFETLPNVWVTCGAMIRNDSNGQLYFFDLVTDYTTYNSGNNCDTLEADLVEPSVLPPLIEYHQRLWDGAGAPSWWNRTDTGRTSFAYDKSAVPEAQCSPNEVSYGYVDAHGADGTTYIFRWNFSVDEFKDLLAGNLIKCNLQYNGIADWNFRATLRVKDNKGLNLSAVNPSTPNANLLSNGTMSGSHSLTTNTEDLPLSKWQFATPTTPEVYAEIKQGDYATEDFDVMSGVPTTENLWVGIGADQYRLSLSGAIIVVGSQKGKDSSSTSAPAWHISGDTRLNSRRSSKSQSLTLPDTKGSYDATFNALWGSADYGQIVGSQTPNTDYTPGDSTLGSGGIAVRDALGTPESDSAIYRVTTIKGIIVGFWGDNAPCPLSCKGHTVGSNSGTAGGTCTKPGWGETATAPGGQCSLCGKVIAPVSVTNPSRPGPTDPDYNASGPSSPEVADNTHECSYKFTFNCSTGVLTFESSEGGSKSFGKVGVLNKYEQSYNLEATYTGQHGTETYENTSHSRDDLIDDGWTVKTSHGCECRNYQNMNHPSSSPWSYYIYETYDMYVTQTLEDWQIMSLVGAEVTDMDDTLFYDTVNAPNAKQYGYKNDGTGEGTAYYAVGTVPFGSRIWKTGVLYNGWAKKLDGECPAVIGREDLLAQYGEENSWYEKRNGRVIFTGAHTMYNWDGVGEFMGDDCKLHSQDIENRIQCIYHAGMSSKMAELKYHTSNYWQDLIGDREINVQVAYDSQVLMNNYLSSTVHANPEVYLSQGKNTRGISDHYSMAFGKYSNNVHYSDSGDKTCWAYRSSTGHMADGMFYTGDIQAPGAPSITSSPVQAYITDAVNYYCRANGYENGNVDGNQYAYSAYCISDTVEMGYMQKIHYFADTTMHENQMIIENGYRIGNSLNIFNCDFTGPDQANIYNHYSQFSVDEIKYSMVNAWIGDSNNPMAGASRRHIDNVGNFMYSSGYVGSQSQPKYGSRADAFQSITMMTLRGQYVRRDSNISVFGIRGAGEGVDNYVAPGGGGEYGNGNRAGYYVSCYTNQGTSEDIQDPKEYKYGMMNIVFIDNSDSTKKWSEAGYWSNYPRWYDGYSFSSNNLNTMGTKVTVGSPMTVWQTETHSNDTELSLWNQVDWDPGPHYKYEGNTEYDRFMNFLDGQASGTSWNFRHTAAMFDNTQYVKYGSGDINFYASDSGTMNATRFNNKCVYGFINGIKMWPYAPNGVYSNPVEVQASYTTFNSYTGTAGEGQFPLIPLSNLDGRFNGKYTDTYVNEAGADCSKIDVAVVNDIVVHNPISAEYSTVISNGMTGVDSSEISGFIDESDQDMRYGPSTIWDGTKYVNYEDLAEDKKLDYWVIGNTCNIWVSDLGDFRSNSSEPTTSLVRPTTKTGVNSGILGTVYDSSGKLHINNNALRDERIGVLNKNESEMKGQGYADRMLTSQWIYGRYVKFPCAVTFESGGNVYVVEKDTWLDLNKCTPTSTGGVSTIASGLSLIPSSLKGANENDMNLYVTSAYDATGMWKGNIRKPIDPQVPGMVSCTSYKNFYNGVGKPYDGANDKQFDYGLNYTFRILGSAEECIQGTVEFYSMAINDSVNYKKIANGETLTSGDIQKSVDALKFKEASNISRTSTMGSSSSSSVSTNSTFVPGLAENSFRPAYQDGYMADSGAYNYCKVDIVGRIGNLALEDVADFRYSNLFKQVTPDGSWLITGVIRNTDPTMPLTIGAEPIDIYGYDVGSTMKATDGTTDVVVSHSVYNISRYTGTSSTYRNVNAGKYDTYGGKNWFSLPLTPGKNNLDEYKTQSVKLGYDAFFDIETIGNYYGNNLTDEGPDHWDTTKPNLGDTRKQVMTIVPHYLLYDYMTGEFVDDIKIWYGEQNNYALCYDGNVGAASFVKDGGVPINDITSGLYQDVMKESDRRNVSGKLDYGKSKGSYTSEGGLTRAVELLTGPANNFGKNALNSGTRWIGNSSRIVLDGFDRNFMGSWYFYQKADGTGFDATFGAIMKQPNGTGAEYTNWQNHVGYGVTDVDFATQSQRWFFKLALPSSSYISTSTFEDINDGGTIKPIIDGGTTRQDGIVYSHEQLQEKHPNSVLICYLDVKVKGEIYTLRYKGLHTGDENDIFDPDTPDKPGKPENPPEDPDNPWTPPFNKIPEPDSDPDPNDPDKPGPEPEWEPVITFDPWDNSSTDLAVYGTH